MGETGFWSPPNLYLVRKTPSPFLAGGPGDRSPGGSIAKAPAVTDDVRHYW